MLEAQHKHIIRLIARDRGENGWAMVSETLFLTLSANMPKELVEFEKLEKGGRARLTNAGENVFDAMAWIN